MCFDPDAAVTVVIVVAIIAAAVVVVIVMNIDVVAEAIAKVVAVGCC